MKTGVERKTIDMGPASFDIVPSIYVPTGRCQIDVDLHQVLVNPAYMDTFLGMLSQSCDDQDGERSFAA